ncbi:MAG: transglutaminase-like domain-containing protein [Candidatus Anammoxibacter sp.]
MKIRDIKDGGGYILKNNAHLRFPLMGSLEPLDMDMEVRLLSNYSFKEGEFRVQSRNYFFAASLKHKLQDTYELTLETPSHKETRMIKRKNRIINLMFSPISLNYVPLKKKVFYAFYDPILNRDVNVLLENKGKVNINIKGQNLQAYKIVMDVEGVKGLIFVDNKGRLLKEEFLGFTFVKEDAQELFKRDFPSSGVDLINYFSIPAIELPDKERLSYMKVKIEGIPAEYIREDFNQELSILDNAYIVEIYRMEPTKSEPAILKQEDFGAYLEEGKFIKFDSPLVRDTVNSIVGKEKDPLIILKQITDWINRNIEKVPRITLPNTMDVLKLKQGDCGELSALMAGFLRCVGIPAYVNIGIVYNERRFFYHAWVSAYVGEWIDTDPALNQLIADPTHIKLLTGLTKQFELSKIIPKLKIEILDYK